MYKGGMVKNYPKKDDGYMGYKAEYIIVDDPWFVMDDVTYSMKHLKKEMCDKAKNLVIQDLEQGRIKQLEHSIKVLIDRNEELKNSNEKLKNIIIKLIMKIKNYKRILNPIKKEKYKRRFTL
jgi:hypothetical protein